MSKEKVLTVIAIDPGKGGGIAVRTKNRTSAVKMPKTVGSMNEYFKFLKETYPNSIVFIEKVQHFGSDDDNIGKKFAIAKMMANYNQLLTIIEIVGFMFVEVYPISWQSGLGLRFVKPKGVTQEKHKTFRKRKYKEFAQKKNPEFKVNLQIADALCILDFSELKLENEFSWVLKNAKGVVMSDGFFKRG